jgi:choline dehydrogenase-like flavoprotein
MTEREVDICIVGSGAAGGMAEYVFTPTGKCVVALEAGPPRTLHEYTMDEQSGSGV